MTHPLAATTHDATLGDIHAVALESLPRDVHDYLEGGAGEEWTWSCSAAWPSTA
ncbi:hypothetical protein [Nonomuraea turcica]|uniref:hypothetical protein n=1 Tax=Nonomuraea sp. G32 TaxID=3067274 RepID=UPI00273B5218|nr:hypothetical protein [Nonomuraea sp. G32]MDP4504426.1 hypothetical protein [Nonomuraea sp. G32]